MKINKLDLSGKENGKIDMPVQFEEELRPDIIRRAFMVIRSRLRQVYGPNPRSGKEVSAKLSRRRRKYRGSYGLGISRVPRKILTRRGTRFYWVGAFAPGTVGGYRAHPPKLDHNWEEGINKKERRKAIRSAISATLNKDLVSARGHILPDNYPFVIDSGIESLSKAKDAVKVLVDLGFGDELKRGSIKKVRAGKGKNRGRPYKRRKSILLVTSGKCSLVNAVRNIPGVDIAPVDSLNADILAPGAQMGRLTLWTENAVKLMKEKRLYL